MPMQKSTTEITDKGYRWGRGCCGMFLMGPFGLLCGLCGTSTKTKVENELWWICKTCGKQHISIESAQQKWDAVVLGSIGSGVSAGIIFLILRWLDIRFISFWGEFFALIAPVLSIYDIYKEISSELGASFFEYMTPDQKKTVLKNIIIAIVLVLGIGFFGIPILEGILGE